MEKIICVAGPTASGKTRLAVELAKKYDGEVLSCDSMQIYRGMEIGTAAPAISEMQGVAAPYDRRGRARRRIFPLENTSSSPSPFCRISCRAAKPASCAAGQGCMRTVCFSGARSPRVPSTGVREKLEAEVNHTGIEPVLARLKEVDPESAARLHPSDRRRIIRALEVYLETGETISEHNRKTKLLPPKHDAVWLGLSFENRQDLYDRIDLRVEKMLEAGLLDEIRALLSSGVPPTATAMQAIGYKEFVDALTNSGDVAAAAALVQQRSRNYAKRQLTWLRRNEQIHWILQPREPDFSAVFQQACANIPFFA